MQLRVEWLHCSKEQTYLSCVCVCVCVRFKADIICLHATTNCRQALTSKALPRGCILNHATTCKHLTPQPCPRNLRHTAADFLVALTEPANAGCNHRPANSKPYAFETVAVGNDFDGFLLGPTPGALIRLATMACAWWPSNTSTTLTPSTFHLTAASTRTIAQACVCVATTRLKHSNATVTARPTYSKTDPPMAASRRHRGKGGQSLALQTPTPRAPSCIFNRVITEKA
jgi:hypothetical protein